MQQTDSEAENNLIAQGNGQSKHPSRVYKKADITEGKSYIIMVIHT